MKIILLKLGGSLITDKSKPYTAKPEIISQIFTEIKDVLNKNPDLRLVIGHGAGSFAHQSAKKYDTINGFKDNESKFGACFVHTDAMKLHQIVAEEAMKVQLPIYMLQPSAFILSNDKQIDKVDFSTLKAVLNNAMIPMIYGDVIIDTKIGATIFSTDKLFSILAEKLPTDAIQITKIIHAGNYDGVLDDKGNVISKINQNNFSQFKKMIGVSEHIDISGGMFQKVQESMDIAAKGIPSYIMNGNIKNNISKALNGDHFNGTKICLR